MTGSNARPRPEEQIRALDRCSAEDLRKRFAETFGNEPPGRIGRDLLIRAIAHRIQEQVEGGLSPALRRRIRTLAAELQRTGRIPTAKGPPVKVGTRLIRDWQGATHEVCVIAGGYVYRDERRR